MIIIVIVIIQKYFTTFVELSEVHKGPCGGVVGEVVEIGRNLGISWHWSFLYLCICTFFLRILPFVYFHLRVSHRAHHHLYLTPTHVDL